MTVTTATLIEDTKQLLLTDRREEQNKLNADVTSGATTLSFEFPLRAIAEGATLQVGLELFYVWSVNSSAQTATVEPAQQGSVAADHDTGDIVTVNPKFPDHKILGALNDDLRDLSSPLSGLYSTKTVDLSWVASAGGYDLTGVTGIGDISDVWLQRGGATSKDWQQLTNYRLDRNADTDIFSSGFALYLTDVGDVGAQFRVQYRGTFAPLSSLADDVVAVTGLPATAVDIPPLGAAARLIRPREVARNDLTSQGDTRRAGEVPPGAIRRSGDQLWADRARRIANEAARLGQANPVQSYVPSRSAYLTSTYSALRY